jgi:hypothetical protein
MAVTQRRKLLTAAVGVATVSYVVACGGLGGGETSGNLVAPRGGGASAGYGGAETSGNLVAAGGTSMGGQGSSAGYAGGETSGNLVAPPPPGGAGPTPGDAGARDAATPEGADDGGAAADAAAPASDADVD